MFTLPRERELRGRSSKGAGVAPGKLSLAMSAFLYFGHLTQPGQAHAYTIESPITVGCHEHIARDAYRQVRKEVATAGPIARQGDDDALLKDLEFTIDDDLNDETGIALFIGIRYPDIQGIPSTALDELTQITSYDNEQDEHCLRSQEDREPNGTAQAIAECHSFMLTQFISSLDGLDASGTPDVNLRDDVRVGLSVRRTQTVSLQRFYYRIGVGLHTLQDSFAHTYRETNDPTKITTALDWIDYADNTIDESVTGPPHLKELDRCDDPDPMRATRHQLAVDATYEILRAALEPTFTREQKVDAFENTMTKYATFDTTAKCTAANGWCNAPEHGLSNPSCACHVAGAGAGKGKGNATFAIAGFGGLGAAIAWRRRRRGARRRGKATASKTSKTSAVGGGVLLCILTLAGRDARAQGADAGAAAPEDAKPSNVEANPAEAPVVHDEPAPQVSKGSGPVAALEGKSASAQPGVEDVAGAKFVALTVGGSWDNPALSVALGGRYQLNRQWMVGLDAEWNPYLAIGESTFRAGDLNIYASLIRRFQLAYERVNIRSTLSLGASVLLTDLVGAPSGSFGPYVGIGLLGVEYKAAKGVYLIFDPTYYALPVPHVTGVPFVYPQWRPTLGIEFGG